MSDHTNRNPYHYNLSPFLGHENTNPMDFHQHDQLPPPPQDFQPSCMSFTEFLQGNNSVSYSTFSSHFDMACASSEADSSRLVDDESSNRGHVFPGGDNQCSSSTDHEAAAEDDSASESRKDLQPQDEHVDLQKSNKVNKPQKKKEKRPKGPRFAFMTKSEVDNLEDGYRWRKYGQKAVKNSPFPRSYYRCTTQRCTVKKRIERSFEDPTVVITTYEGQHNHHCPATLRGNVAALMLTPPPFLTSTLPVSGFPEELMINQMDPTRQNDPRSSMYYQYLNLQQQQQQIQPFDQQLFHDMVPSFFPKRES